MDYYNELIEGDEYINNVLLKEYESNWNHSQNFYKKEILSTMTNDEIIEIIQDKWFELKNLELELTTSPFKKLKWFDVYKAIFQIDIINLQKTIKELKYILDDRLGKNKKWNLMEDFIQLKKSSSIIELIEAVAWVKTSERRNIKCPLPTHKDKTASFKVYTKSNSRYCFWCHKKWDWANFIADYTLCSQADAIKKFISFFNF